jgi:MFS family permease
MLVQNFLFGMVTYPQTYYLPLFMQNARRLSPLTAACLMLPISGSQMISSIASGQYMSRFERYGEVIWLGLFLWTLGVGLTCTFSLDTPLWAIALILTVQGIGIGSTSQPVLVALQAHCSKAHRAIIIANRNFIRSLGGAVGLAISAAALQNSLHSAMPVEFRSLALSSYDMPAFETLDQAQIRHILQAYATASRTVFIMNVPFMVLSLLGCLFIKDRGLVRPGEEDQEVELAAGRVKNVSREEGQSVDSR